MASSRQDGDDVTEHHYWLNTFKAMSVRLPDINLKIKDVERQPYERYYKAVVFRRFWNPVRDVAMLDWRSDARCKTPLAARASAAKKALMELESCGNRLSMPRQCNLK